MATLFLIRGLPGSGKSTLASVLNVPSFAADDFFVGEDGQYRFDPAQLGAAHAQCQGRTRSALGEGASCAVANTFTQRWELEPYFIMARETGARVVVVDLFDAGLDDAALAERNEHGVPVAGIAAMRSRYEHDWGAGNPVPPWERG